MAGSWHPCRAISATTTESSVPTAIRALPAALHDAGFQILRLPTDAQQV